MESIPQPMETSPSPLEGGSIPLVSVVMPAFKAAYLDAAIRSLLAQSFRDFELVVVDDASPDDLRSIVERHPDPRLRYLRNPENIGSRSLVENWNLCLSMARGRFFVLASDDDLYNPEYLGEMVALAARHPDCGVFHSRVSIIDREGREIDRTLTCPEMESWDEFLWHRLKLARPHFIPEFLFRTESLRDVGGFVDFPFAWASDTATCIVVGSIGGIGYHPGLLVSWRSSGQNISTSDRFARAKFDGFQRFLTWAQNFVAGHQSPLRDLILAEIPRYCRIRTRSYLQALPSPLLFDILVSKGSNYPWIRKRSVVATLARRFARASR